MQDDFTWCVSPADSIARWKKIFLIITDPNVQILGILSFIGSVLAIYAMTTFESQPADIWTCSLFAFQSVLGQTSPLQAKTAKLRVFQILGLFLSLFVAIFILAMVSMILSGVTTQNQIDSVQELIDAKFRLAGDSKVLQYLLDKRLV